MAGKITGPGNGGPPGSVPLAPERGGAIGGSETGRPVAEGQAPFADRLKAAEAAGASPASGAPPAIAASGVADLAAALKAGTLTPQAAVNRVIDRIVDKHLGVHAPVGAREKLRAALEAALADDPLLAEKIRSLA
ncbi:MAG TPA: hypothetical protein VHO67_09165 [Polyangia bacterium]|nr:hypothetical protein [Polyangia bacterium]